MSSPLHEPATPAHLRALARAGLIDGRALETGLRLLGARPNAEAWAKFARLQLAAWGAALCVVGVSFFIAANWSALGPLFRLGLVVLVHVLCVFVALRTGLDRTGGRVAAGAAGLLLGPLFALYGQTYQTGADAWTLFAAWAALFIPFAAAARMGGYFLAGWGLVKVAVALWWAQEVGGRPLTPGHFTAHVLLDAVFISAAEWARHRRAAWAPPRWVPRIAATLLGALVTVPGCAAIVDHRVAGGGPLYVVVAVAFAAGANVLYTRVKQDLYMVALGTATAMALAGFSAGKVLLGGRPDLPAVFGLGLLVMAEVVGATLWLKKWRAAFHGVGDA